MGRRRVGVAEAQPLGGQSVGVGRLAGVAGFDHLSLLLVGHEDQNIGSGGHWDVLSVW